MNRNMVWGPLLWLGLLACGQKPGGVSKVLSPEITAETRVVRGGTMLDTAVLRIIDAFSAQAHLQAYHPVYLLYIKKDSVGSASLTVATSSSALFLAHAKPGAYLRYDGKLLLLFNGDENVFALSTVFRRRVAHLVDSTLAAAGQPPRDSKRGYIDKHIWKASLVRDAWILDKGVTTPPQLPEEAPPPPPPKYMPKVN